MWKLINKTFCRTYSQTLRQKVMNEQENILKHLRGVDIEMQLTITFILAWYINARKILHSLKEYF